MRLKSISHFSLTECSDQWHEDTPTNDRRRNISSNEASSYDKVTLEMQKLLDVSRLYEWNKFLKFETVILIPREDAEHMLKNTDAEELPAQCI